jgi:hypothetical protein
MWIMVITVPHAAVVALLEAACAEGNRRLSRGDVTYSSNSNKNEEFVVEVLRSVAHSAGVASEAIHHLGGKSFPDVHIVGSRVGIELKGSQKGGSITGNSIFSGSMVEDLDKVYLLFWIDDRTPKLGYRDYFDCVFDAKVTHSPRFALQVDLPPGKSMFGKGSGQLGFEASDWLTGEGRYVDRIVVEIRRRALERKEIPWWVVTESKEQLGFEADRNGTVGGMGGLRYLRGLERSASFSLQKTLFLGFPEVLSGGATTHSIAIGWAISQKSVIINRDVFSSGGKRPVQLAPPLGRVTLPAVVSKCAAALQRDAPVSLAELSSIHGMALSTPEAAIERFKSKLREDGVLDHLHDHLSVSKKKAVSRSQLRDAVIDTLADEIDPSTLS